MTAALVTIMALGLMLSGGFFVFLPVSMVNAERPGSVGEGIGATLWILSGLGLGCACALLGVQALLEVW